jgi:hypothetical protein
MGTEDGLVSRLPIRPCGCKFVQDLLHAIDGYIAGEFAAGASANAISYNEDHVCRIPEN